MASLPSIQSFFPRQASPHSTAKGSQSGDGFSMEEINAVIRPVVPESWTPNGGYDDCQIASLIPGQRPVKFMGRIVSLVSSHGSVKVSGAAKGHIKIIVKDDSGALTVKLYYTRTEHTLRLGQLVSIWTTRIYHGGNGSFTSMSTRLIASLFPKVTGVAVFALENLVTLKSFVGGGFEAHDFVRKDGLTNDLITINLFDDTDDASLSLWGNAAASAAGWKPSWTVLLITKPGYNTVQPKWLSLTSDTLVDVDPAIPDVAWLRKFAEKITRRTHVNQDFPNDVMLPVNMDPPSTRVLYTLADVDEQARHSSQPFSGYLSMIVMGLRSVELSMQQRLFCTEWY
ncbi:hypothetical protein MBLNU459_g1024t1 [Dothideomycetes sp. NU459]